MTKHQSPLTPIETIISWGRYAISDEHMYDELSSILTDLDRDHFHMEKEHWKKTLLDAGIFALSKKRFEKLFNDLSSTAGLSEQNEISDSMVSVDPDAFLNHWLIRPHMGRYESFYATLSEDQRSFIKEQSILALSKQIHQTGSKRTLFLLLDFHLALEEGIALWYKFTMPQTTITREEKQFLHTMIKTAPEKAAPLIIHSIEWHVEMRSREHYLMSSFYLDQLMSCVKTEQFRSVLTVLNYRFSKLKGFREVILHYEL